MESKKRKLPRHVDGRVMIGIMPWKNFLKFLPLGLIIAYFSFRKLTPVSMFIGVVLEGAMAALFCEIQSKETGFQIVKDTIRYLIEGDKHFERSCLNVSNSERYIENKIARTERKN